MCLIKSKGNDACIHPYCARAKKSPQYHVTRQSIIDGNAGFEKFKKKKSLINDDYWMMAINQVAGKALTEIRTAGNWPIDRDVFNRDEIQVQYAEVLENYPVYNEITKKTEWKEILDVSEFYFYIGGAENEK
ncbi:hypothetical protein ACFOWA_13245 [Pedobacter lithocola]|uniref:Uncharacterized protein n=1 Tax=Pedobacter lithocola TaxID=1908239 RepID=A0ABV8PD62_9SPHI